MYLSLKISFVTILVCNIINLYVLGNNDEISKVAKAFVSSNIVPDVISVPPSRYISITYPSGVRVKLGNKLPPIKVQIKPTVKWEGDPDTFYTLALVDPDAPSRATPLLSEFKHWLVGNIPGSKVEEGQVLAEYTGPMPPPGTGPHRYVFLVYEQPSRIAFNEGLLNNTVSALRVKFSISNFAKQYNLGNPVYGNFFLSQSIVNL